MRKTPKDHSDFQKLQEALDKASCLSAAARYLCSNLVPVFCLCLQIALVATHVNEYIRKRENAES
jgi:hypothetical protein